MTPLSPVTDKLEPCKMADCDKPMFRFGVCLDHWTWLNGEPPRTPHNARDISGGEVERARTSIEELEYIAGHETTPLVVAQAALRAKDVIAALSAMSRDDAGVVTRLVEALRPFAELRLSTEPEISDLVWRSHAAQLREQASAVELRDAQICKAREALSSVGYKENSDG